MKVYAESSISIKNIRTTKKLQVCLCREQVHIVWVLVLAHSPSNWTSSLFLGSGGSLSLLLLYKVVPIVENVGRTAATSSSPSEATSQKDPWYILGIGIVSFLARCFILSTTLATLISTSSSMKQDGRSHQSQLYQGSSYQHIASMFVLPCHVDLGYTWIHLKLETLLLSL